MTDVILNESIPLLRQPVPNCKGNTGRRQTELDDDVAQQSA